MSFPSTGPQSLSSLRPWLSLMNEIRRCTCVRGSTVQTLISKRQGEAARSAVDSGAFRQPVVRSGDAVHRLAAMPRRIPFPAAESLLAPVSPSPTKDGFAIGDSNRNTNGAFVVTSFHGTRLHDRDIRAESIQSLAPHRLAAKASAVQTELHGCPCLAPVLGSPRQRWHRGRAAGSDAGVARREMPPAVAVPSTPRSGGRS